MKHFTKVLAFALIAVFSALAVFADVTVADEDYYAKFRDKGLSLNVYNWGEYISDGAEGTMDVVKEFEAISGIKVNYRQ